MMSLRQVNCTAGGDVSDKRLEKESGISYSTILVLSRNSIGTRPHMSMIRLPSTSPFIYVKSFCPYIRLTAKPFWREI